VTAARARRGTLQNMLIVDETSRCEGMQCVQSTGESRFIFSRPDYLGRDGRVNADHNDQGPGC
jgi:hypothetical protein